MFRFCKYLSSFYRIITPILLIALLHFSNTKPNAQTDIGQPLKLNQTIKRKVKSKERHIYTLKLEAGKFTQIIIVADGVEVPFLLTDSNNQVVIESKSSLGAFSRDTFSFITDSSREYRLEINADPLTPNDASYDITLKTLRQPTEKDKDLIIGEKIFRDAFFLSEQGSRETRQKRIEQFTEAANYLRASDDKYRLAIALNQIGRVYNLLGNRRMALDFYNQGLALRREIKAREGEAVSLTFIGFAYTLSGELQKALDYHFQALKIRRELGNARTKAVSLFHIGLVYFRLGEPEHALSYQMEALTALRAAGDKVGESRALIYAGDAAFTLGRYQEALDYFERCLILQDRDFGRLIARNVLRRIAAVYMKTGQTQKALDVLTEAITLENKYGDSLNKANILVGLGEVNYTLGDKQKAHEYFVQALPILQSIEDRTSQAKTHYLLALIERDNNNLTKALTEIESAVGLIEVMRSRILSQELRASFFATAEKYYDLYLQILWQLNKEQPTKGFDEKALNVSEQTRARSLIELLNESQIDIRQGVSPELLARERELQKQLNERAQAQTILFGEKLTKEQSAELAKEIQDITFSLQEVQAQIRKQSPRYTALTQPQTLSLQEIRQTLESNDILLEYKLGEEKSFLWAITKDKLQTFELPKRAEIETLSRRTYQLLTARNHQIQNETDAQRTARIEQTEKEFNKAATQLSQILLQPVASILKSQRLLIVSDGALQYIPFAALPQPSSKFQVPSSKFISNNLELGTWNLELLIQNHEIISLPSASVISVLRREIASRNSASKTLAIFADPVFAKDDVRVNAKGRDNKQQQDKKTLRGVDGEWFANTLFVNGNESRPAITRLPFSRREANSILAIVPPNESFAALDFAANRKSVLNSRLSDYRIVHFATHGWLDSNRPELSGIVLSLVNEKGQTQDGFLRLHEIYNLELNADLVVLSACQTALGKEVRGEGLVGLTRGFMYAGALRVAASLWKVDDAATAELMSRFYHFMLREKMSPPAALRSAQLELMKQKRWNAPYFWASFVLQGEWR